MFSQNNIVSRQEQINKLVKFFFCFQFINKLYHWNTSSFARHKATDGFNNIITDLVDRFVEVYIGIYKTKPIVESIKLDKTLMTDDGIIKLFTDARDYLRKLHHIIQDTELLNIRDEILVEINKTLYLFELN